MATSRPKNDQDKLVQGWLDTNDTTSLSTFLDEHPDLIDSNFVLYYDAGYGWGVNSDSTLLQYAIKKEKPEIAFMLLNKGANPNEKGILNTPPIFDAIYDESIFKAMIKKGASIYVKNRFGETLHKVLNKYKNDPRISENVIKFMKYGVPFPNNQIENYTIVEPGEENIFGEELEDGTTVAFLDPIFRGQRIVAVRANGTPTNTWKKVQADKKNPWTRAAIDPAKVELQKVVVGPSVNLNGGKSRRRQRRRSCRKNRTQRRRK